MGLTTRYQTAKRIFGASLIAALSLLQIACSQAAFDTLPLASPPPKLADAGIVSFEHSTIAVAPDQVADGSTPADILLTLRNAMNEPLPGILMALEVTGSGNVLSSCTTSDTNGRSRCRFYSTVSEWKTIRVVGNVTFTADTMFAVPLPSSSAFGVVTSSGSETLVTGQRLVAMSGISESNASVRDGLGYVRIFSSVLGSVVGE